MRQSRISLQASQEQCKIFTDSGICAYKPHKMSAREKKKVNIQKKISAYFLFTPTRLVYEIYLLEVTQNKLKKKKKSTLN